MSLKRNMQPECHLMEDLSYARPLVRCPRIIKWNFLIIIYKFNYVNYVWNVCIHPQPHHPFTHLLLIKVRNILDFLIMRIHVTEVTFHPSVFNDSWYTHKFKNPGKNLRILHKDLDIIKLKIMKILDMEIYAYSGSQELMCYPWINLRCEKNVNRQRRS